MFNNQTVRTKETWYFIYIHVSMWLLCPLSLSDMKSFQGGLFVCKELGKGGHDLCVVEAWPNFIELLYSRNYCLTIVC